MEPNSLLGVFFWGFLLIYGLVMSPGVRIVVASPVFPKKAYRGRKETGRAVLFT